MIPPLNQQVYCHPVTVTRDQIDNLQHVNNVVYLEWVQNAAAAHWEHAAPDNMRAECMWVVTRHEIDYLAPAVEGDSLSLCTWVDASNGAKQDRHVSIQRASDGKELAYAKTTWCLLDPRTGRPKRISKELEQLLRSEKGQ
jgi:acyl-CoA thioester hydrolase